MKKRKTSYPEVEHPLPISDLDAAYRRQAGEVSTASDLVRPLRPVSFEYKDEYKPEGGAGRQVGILADDLKKTPAGRSMVREGPDGMDRVDTGKLTMGLAAVLAEQQREIDRLRNVRVLYAEASPGMRELAALERTKRRENAQLQSIKVPYPEASPGMAELRALQELKAREAAAAGGLRSPYPVLSDKDAKTKKSPAVRAAGGVTSDDANEAFAEKMEDADPDSLRRRIGRGLVDFGRGQLAAAGGYDGPPATNIDWRQWYQG